MSDNQYNWLEIKARPKKDGLHDSGYRYIQVRGIREDAGIRHVTDLHQWSDHVTFRGFSMYQGVNIDFEANGTMRIMPWGGGYWSSDDVTRFFSDAMFKYEDRP